MARCGYLYCVYDTDRMKFLKQAKESARSLRKHDSKAHITLLIDQKVDAPEFDTVKVISTLKPEKLWRNTGDYWDLVDGRFEGKMKVYFNSPYDRTLYIDADTHFFDNSRGLFEVLDYFDMAMVPVAGDSDVLNPATGRPIQGLTPYNAGVILFGKNAELTKCWNLYNRYYREQRSIQKRRNDQPYLMLAISHTQVRVHSLPRIYNARINRPLSLFGKVVIAHGHTNNWEKIGKKINKTTDIRYWRGNES